MTKSKLESLLDEYFLDRHTPRQRLADEYNLSEQKFVKQFFSEPDGSFTQMSIMLEIVADCLADNSPLIPPVAAYLEKALRKIAKGESANQAFNFKRKRGEKDLREARGKAFSHAYSIEYLRMKNKITVDNAIIQVAEITGLSEETLRDQWKKHHKLAKRELELQLRRSNKLLPLPE